jgi:hypothetical protein
MRLISTENGFFAALGNFLAHFPHLPGFRKMLKELRFQRRTKISARGFPIELRRRVPVEQVTTEKVAA